MNAFIIMGIYIRVFQFSCETQIEDQ